MADVKLITSYEELTTEFRNCDVEENIRTKEFRVYQGDAHVANITQEVWEEIMDGIETEEN